MSSTPIDSYQTSLELHDGLFFDIDYPGRGHRVNILGENWTDVGVGYRHKSIQAGFPDSGAVTCNFGDNKGEEYVLLGVVYKDTGSDELYDTGEGVAHALSRDLTSGAMAYKWYKERKFQQTMPNQHLLAETNILPPGIPPRR
jgi:hypothetical protein